MGPLTVVFESATWGNFQVAAATAAKKEGAYTFSGSGKVAMGMGGGPAKDYDFTVSGSTNAAKDDYSIVFKVPAVMGGLTVTLLPGTAPATEE